MRNYELVNQLYMSLKTAEKVGPGITRNFLIEECINLVERERPQLKQDENDN